MLVSIDVDISGALKQLNLAQTEQVPFALSKALNETAFHVAKKELPAHMDKTFEGGATAWTKRGFQYQKATKRQLVAIVNTKEGTHDYIALQVEGGIGKARKAKILKPTKNARLNKYGNISKAQRTKYSDKGKFFFGKPKGQTVGEGVWERMGRGKRIRKVASLVDSITYAPKLDVIKPVEVFVNNRFEAIFTKHLINALRSAK